MKNKTLNVPETFGDIRNVSSEDEFNPWEVSTFEEYDEDGNPIYSFLGRFETFNDALLGLIIVNSANKKQSCGLKDNLSKKDKEYIDSKINEYFHDIKKKVNYKTPGSHGPLLVKFAGINDHLPDFPFDGLDDIEESIPASYIRSDIYANSVVPSYTNASATNLISHDNELFNYTVRDVYEHWFKDKKLEDITPHTLDGYVNSWKKISHLADKRFLDLRFSDIYACVKHEKEIGNSFSMRKRMKLFFSQLFQWAIAHELCNYNLALNVKLGKNESDFHRKHFSLEQIGCLFAHVDEDPFVEEVLMLILNGCRIREFLNIKRQDIHMDQRYFIVTESKTKAGRNRMVPIHKKMMKYYRKRLRARSDYLIHDARGRQMEYTVWAKKFSNLMKRFGWEGLSPHSARHSLITLLHSAGADETTSRYITGHVIGDDIHTRVYTHIIVQDIIKAIDMI